MSFMEGFANAVSENITDKRKRKRDLEDDVFRSNYSRYISNLDEKKEQSKLESKAFSQADYLTKRYNLPPQASKVIAKALASGLTVDTLIEDLKTGTMEFGQTAQPQGPAKADVSTEMKTSGLDPEMVEEETPVNGIETGRTPIAIANMSPDEKRKSSAQEKSVLKIAEVTGEDEETIRENLFGKTQQDLSPVLNWSYKASSTAENEWMAKFPLDDLDKARAEIIKMRAEGKHTQADKAQEMVDRFAADDNIPDLEEGTLITRDKKTGKMIYVKGKTEKGMFYIQKDGKYEEQGTPLRQLEGQVFDYNDKMKPEDMKRVYDIVQPFQEQKQATLKNIKLSKEAMTIVSKTNGQALTETAGFVSRIQGLSNELDAIQNLIRTSAASGDITQAVDLGLTKLKETMKPIEESGLNEDARRLFRIQLDMVYSQLKAYGESSNGISNLDIKNVMDSIFDAKPENFTTHLMKQINTNVDNLEYNRTSILENAGPLIASSYGHQYMVESSQNQLLNIAREDERAELETFLRESKALDDTNYRVQKREDNPQSETMQVAPKTEDTTTAPPGMKLVGRSTDDGSPVYEDENGNRFKGKK